MEQKPESVSSRNNESRNTYVLEQLSQALLELLEQKPLAEISISELCEQAGVGRTSFYRNFESKEDIVRRQIRQLFQKSLQPLKDGSDLSLPQIVELVFSHLEANRSFYGLLNKRNLTDLIQDVLLEFCGFNPDQPLAAAYSSAFIGFFLYGWIETWFCRGMKDATEELLANLPSQ